MSVIANPISVRSASFVSRAPSLSCMAASRTPGSSGRKYLPCKPSIRESPVGVHQTYSEVHIASTLTALSRKMLFRMPSVYFSRLSRDATSATMRICMDVTSDGRRMLYHDRLCPSISRIKVPK